MSRAFWLVMTAACLLWYTTVTGYVAVKGARDIKAMLRRLRERAGDDPPR